VIHCIIFQTEVLCLHVHRVPNIVVKLAMMALVFIICSTVMYTVHMDILYLKLNGVCFKIITVFPGL